MALLRKLFFRKPPDGLLEICERVYVFDCCFTTDSWKEKNYEAYLCGIVAQLREHLADASFLVFNFRRLEMQSQMGDILSKYEMTIMDYPQQYEGCPVLTMEVLHHFLRSCESWLSLGQNNVLLMHCERGGWPVLAFMLSALLIFRKQYSGEQRTLDMVYRQAPRELLHVLSPMNPVPSQLRYLQYIARRNVALEWPPMDRALTLDCIILRFIPNVDGEGGCRPIFRIYGQDPLLVSDRAPKVLYSTPKRSKNVRSYKQVESELVKIDINCHIQGDVVLECISLHDDMESEEMMFRAMFNTAFIRSNILIVNREEIDTLWNAKDKFPKEFRAEILFSEMDAGTSTVPNDILCIEEDGLPIEAFAKVQEIFSHVDWLDPKADVALNMLHQMNALNIAQEKTDNNSLWSTQFSSLLQCTSPRKLPQKFTLENKLFLEKEESVRTSKFSPDAAKTEQNNERDSVFQQVPRSSEAFPLNYDILLDSRNSERSNRTSHSASVGSHSFLVSEGETEVSHLKTASSSFPNAALAVSLAPESLRTKIFLTGTTMPPPPHISVANSVPYPPPPPTASALPSNNLSTLGPDKSSLTEERKIYSKDQSQLSTIGPPLSVTSAIASLVPQPPPPPPPPLCTSTVNHTISSPVPLPPPPPPPSLPMSSKQDESTLTSPFVPPPPPPPLLMTSMQVGSTSTSSSVPPPPPPLPFRQVEYTSTFPSVPPPPPPPTSTTGSSSAVPSAPPPPTLSGRGTSKSGELCSDSLLENGLSRCPPPPNSYPSGIKGRSLSRTINSRSHITKKLKPLHWLKLSKAVQGSLWAETQKTGEVSRAPEIDMSELESLFSAAVPAPDLLKKSGGPGSVGNKPEKVQLIDHRRAYNCEIMLSKVKVPLQDLMSSVLDLEDAALDIDQVENLIKFCPTKEEMDLLKGYTGEKEKLGKCEQFFLELMQVPRVECKLRVFSFKMQFSCQVTDLKKSLNFVNSAAEEIKSSVKLKRVMQTILSLGNALNQGTARGSAIGFRLDSLLKLTETRARNNKMTLMHYLCKILADKLPEVLDFSNDLASLEPASKVQLKILAEEMQAISKGLEKIVQELSTSENDGPISNNFRMVLKEFLRFAEAEVRTLASLYSSVGRNVDSLILYFGEDPARCPFEQVMSTLCNFVSMFNRAHEENCKQIELELKKATEKEKSKTGHVHKKTSFVKVLKNKAYFKRYQVKYRRRREGKTDYRARKRLITQDKNKYNSPKYRLVVRITNKKVICQIAYAEIDGDKILCQATSAELPRYGLTVGLKNYAAAYATGLLVGRRVLQKLGLDEDYEGNTEVDGEIVKTESNGRTYFVDEVADEKRPFRCYLDCGLRSTTTGNRVFGALKGAADAGLDIPHSEKRFPGYSRDDKSYDAEVHRDRIFAIHVSEHMKELEEDDPEMLAAHYAEYVKAGIDPDELEDQITKVHEAIRADPSPAAKKDHTFDKKYKKQAKRSRQQRQARVAQKKAHAASKQ